MGALDNSKRETACQAFVLEEINKTQAFRRGYPLNKSKKYIQSIRANELFNRPEVIVRVAELRAVKAKIANDEFEINAKYVLNRLVQIDRMDVIDIITDEDTLKPISEWPPVWRQFIAAFDVEELFAGRGDERLRIGLLKKVKWPDKIRNLELLGKHIDVSAFKENIGLTGPGGGPIQTITTTMTPQEAAEAYADTLNDE